MIQIDFDRFASGSEDKSIRIYSAAINMEPEGKLSLVQEGGEKQSTHL